MSKRYLWKVLSLALALGLLAVLAPGLAQAASPVVKTVPWVATNPLIPHDTYSGKTITLKGTCDSQGANFSYSWDFGDGSAPATGTVSNKFAIEATHAYTGAVGTVFTARLTVTNTSTVGEVGTQTYYVIMQNKSQAVEVNIAIDEGLWFLHKDQRRYSSGGKDYGVWDSGGYASSGYYGNDAVNVNAFEVNGHLEGGPASNPYTETVARGMRQLFAELVAENPTGWTSQTNPLGTFNPDSNGNNLYVRINQGNYVYQTGMMMDAIVASGTPDAVATTGLANIAGRKYKDIVQDMVDFYAWAQYDGGTLNPPYGGGGWRYNPQDWPDNSVCQWAAIGMLAAEKSWGVAVYGPGGILVPPWLKTWNVTWLAYSQANDGSGRFGYDRPDYYPWGPYADTPSGLVQCVLNGIGRGDPVPGPNNKLSWDKAETFLRDTFTNGGDGSSNIKAYYYGLFSFVKSMLLHNHNGVPAPIQMLQSTTPGKTPIDWYHAEVASGDPTDGVARTLINGQSAAGYWWGHAYGSGTQQYFETAWAIIMLNRTVFEAGAPVAVAKAIPNPGVVGQDIVLDGSDSYHQDISKSIVKWQWDTNNDGNFEQEGPVVHTSFGALGNYPVKLRVTDNGTPPRTADTTFTVQITLPPIAPTADAGGPYVFCPQAKPWRMDGTKSNNPDEGRSEFGYPGDTIYANANQFAWDLDGTGNFNNVYGQQPDVTAFFTGKGPGIYLVQLKVTDTTRTSFPSSGQPNLIGISSAQVTVKASDDLVCTGCVKDLAARAKLNRVQLTWSFGGTCASYNVYRGAAHGGPYALIANTTSTSYLDSVPLGPTVYYVVRPVALNSNELCESNEANATPSRPPR
jgi:PKD repeat protein